MSEEINSETENLIQHVEELIQQWMLAEFSRKIGVSVQLPSSYQGNRRPVPKNFVCREIYKNATARQKCDMSDQVMKHLSLKDEMSIAYRCHGDLSNIVIPHYDTITKTTWFIFIGQFVIMDETRCDDCKVVQARCRATQRILKKEEIQILDENKINNLAADDKQRYNGVVKPVFFGSHYNEKMPQDYVIDIHQLIMCKRKAIKVLNNEIQKSTESSKTEIIKYCKQHKSAANLSALLKTIEHEKPI